MLCPKCHRPLADDSDGVYICCAHASLRWQCLGCAKISEGFALPYGLCPQCGGKLQLCEGGTTASAESERAIRMAFEIELGGRAFYQRAAADTTDPVLKALFGRFALMEGEHMETLARRYHLDVPEPAADFRIELAAIFADVESRPQDPANLFRIAIALEERAAAFFSDRAAHAEAGSAEHRLFLELAAEEREHADLLSVEYSRWQAGQPGLFSVDHLGRSILPAGTAPADGAPMNAAETLLAGLDPERTALCCGAQTLSRAALRTQVAQAAGAWRAQGLGPGDRVAIKLDDGVAWVIAYLGAIWAGAVAVAVNPRIPAPEWQYILDEAGFSAILAESAQDTPLPWRKRVKTLAAWQVEQGQADPIEACPMPPDGPAFWCHSSGTSGKPKAVVHAHRTVLDIERVSREGLGLRADDRLYASSKLFFSYALTNSLLVGLKLGATVILEPAWPNAANVAETVAAQTPTVLFSVPSLYRNMLHEGAAPAIGKAGVRLCVSAGEALPASLRNAWSLQTGVPLINGYGASETLVLVMLGRDDAGFMPSPGIDIDPLEPVAVGMPTRLKIRSSTLALGYLDRPAAQAEAFRDGTFCPADLFARNAAGGWDFGGREDSLVKIGGRWVDLTALEEQLLEHTPGIIEAAAVCVPDDDGVDSIALFYVAASPAAAATALHARAQTLAHHQRPRWLHAVPALPRTPTGKLLRRRLQELHRHQA